MAYNIVRDAKQDGYLYATRRGLGDAIDWMMSRIAEFDPSDFDDIAAEEVQEDGEVTGWWSIDDLFGNNPNGWELPDGTIVKDPRGDE